MVDHQNVHFNYAFIMLLWMAILKFLPTYLFYLGFSCKMHSFMGL